MQYLQRRSAGRGCPGFAFSAAAAALSGSRQSAPIRTSTCVLDKHAVEMQFRATRSASHQTHQVMTLLVLQQHHLHASNAASRRRQDTIVEGQMPSKHCQHASPHAIHGQSPRAPLGPCTPARPRSARGSPVSNPVNTTQSRTP